MQTTSRSCPGGRLSRWVIRSTVLRRSVPCSSLLVQNAPSRPPNARAEPRTAATTLPSTRCVARSECQAVDGLKIGEILSQAFRVAIGSDRADHHWQWIGPNVWQIRLARYSQGERQAFCGRNELRIDSCAIPTRIRTIPADAGKLNGVQPMEAKPMTFVIEAEPLITEPGSDAVGPEQGREQMTSSRSSSRCVPGALPMRHR